MNLSISRALLIQIRDQLTSDDTLLAWFRRRGRRRALAAALELLIEEGGSSEAASDLVIATRLFWEAEAGVRVDDPAAQRIDRDGIWLSGWLRARTGIVTYDRIDPARFATAIERLPAISREVFLLHSREDLDFGRIAARLRMSPDDVQDELARVLLELDAALHETPEFPDGADGKPIA
jgi:DNA-directed RNA polymerase specialized sigma24 family protein